MPEPEISYVIEVPGIYDGWSVAVCSDGSMRNRWANDDGTPREGYERRWRATQDWIEENDHVAGS